MEATKGTWSTQETFRFSALKWTPVQDSYFDSLFAVMGVSASVVTEKLLGSWCAKTTAAISQQNPLDEFQPTIESDQSVSEFDQSCLTETRPIL